MKSSKKALIVMFVLGISLFGYSQYASASKIGVEISQSQLLEENEEGSMYSVALKFENPSLLVLTAGETDFFVVSNDEIIGKGKLEPFTLPAMGNSIVKGMFHTDTEINSEQIKSIKINGVTKYDVLFTSLNVPFVFFPTEEQAREFIHQR